MRHSGWLVLVYRVPTEPSNARVSVWRDLKRLGVLYLQQCVCILPNRSDLRKGLDAVREKISGRHGGSSNLFEVKRMPGPEEQQLYDGFRDLSARQYAEIVEECETKFVREVEFETFRENFTFAEAEEIEQDLDKIRRWFKRVQERDWFEAPGRAEVTQWIDQCASLLDDFYAKVHERTASDPGVSPDAAEMDSNTRRLPRLAVAPTHSPSGPPDHTTKGAVHKKRSMPS